MITKIQKWGNSLGVRIPKSVAQEARVKEGMQVDVREKDNRLVITPVEKTHYSLDALLRRVSSKNLHKEIDSGLPRGKEVW